MTAETRRDIGKLLAEQLDSIQPTLDVMSHPYRRAEEMTRRVELALVYLENCWLDCKCGLPDHDGPCERHDLEAILLGDR